jgi:hypothetical protein
MMMGTTHGLVGRALTTNFDLFNGASHITAADSGSGLTPARVAVEMGGQGGAWILLIMLFMAIVSTGCAEIIAVATIMTYDVYCEYLNPELKEERMRARQIFYALACDKPAKYEKGKELVTVDEMADKMVAMTRWSEVEKFLPKLEEAQILPFGRTFTNGETKAIEVALKPHTSDSGDVTWELVYSAVNSQSLCKTSCEADVMLRVMKFFCVCFAVFMGFLAVFLQTLGLGLGFVYMSMGIFVGPAVAPAAMAILMEKASRTWCTAGAIVGLFGGIATWIIVAYALYEELSLSSLGGDYPFLWSNVVSICLSGAVAIAGSLANPDTEFKWKHLNAKLPLVDDMPPPIENGLTPEKLDEQLVKDYKHSVWSANFLFVFLCLLLPVSLYLSGAVFGKTGFGIWVIIYMLWCFIGGMAVIILPVLDFKKDLEAASASKKMEADKEALAADKEAVAQQ